MEKRLPIPKNWQEFERICHRLWQEIWADPSAQLNGRSGQSQNGVDIYGRSHLDQKWNGVQCKDKDGILGSELNPSELVAECGRARSFLPHLSFFILATTAPRDNKLQEFANQLNVDGKTPFGVCVWSWNDIEEEILWRPRIIDAYYSPFHDVAHLNPPKIRLSALSPRDQLAAFFSRPAVTESLPDLLRQRFVQLAHELRDNAFTHGLASTFQVSLDEMTVRIEDDGAAFNPINQLDATKTNAQRYIGSAIFELFQKTFCQHLKISYSQKVKNNKSWNVLEFCLNAPPHTIPRPSSVEFFVDINKIGCGRFGAVRFADTICIPSCAKEVVLVLPVLPFYSGSTEIIWQVLQKLPKDTNLIVSLSRSDYEVFDEIGINFGDERVSIRPRS
jgi:hypothetical protein